VSVHTRSSSLTIDALPARSAPDASAAEVETRHLLAPVVIGVLSLALMFAVAAAEGLPIRDPDARYVGSPLALIGVILLTFLVLDLVPRTVRRARAEGISARDAARTLFLERWWGRRGVIVVACILGFYATYLSYRNLKSFLPFMTDGQHDGGLADFDRWLFFGHDPATLLHDLLGTGISADILSASYLAFLTFVPVSLGIVLIWSSRVAVGVWYVTALALNWILGALSYYLIPSMGPIYAEPRLFAELPVTGTSELQQTLLEHRTEVINDPGATNAVQSIAAFASLHMAVVFTAALIAHLARAPRGLRIALWVYLGLTALSTIYFGWHYVSDDVAGLAIGAFAVFAAGMLAGIWRHPREAFSRLKQPSEGAA
jgi:membrane-associated phospholipid phosphatase